MTINRNHNARKIIATLLAAVALPAAILVSLSTQPASANPPLQAAQVSPTAQPGSQLFPETGKTVSGRFLQYWQQHGGLAQQGYPISGELQEVSDTDGKTYTVQYFERAVFELHPENQAPNDVLLSLLGVFSYNQKYPTGAASQSVDNSAGSVLFPQTGHRLGGKFLTYWQQHGGLAQQGYPISDEFTEVSPLNGKTYTVQYFERAVFEAHPENAAPYDVLLSQLGTFRYGQKYNSSQNVPGPTQTGGNPPGPVPTAPLPISTAIAPGPIPTGVATITSR